MTINYLYSMHSFADILFAIYMFKALWSLFSWSSMFSIGTQHGARHVITINRTAYYPLYQHVRLCNKFYQVINSS